MICPYLDENKLCSIYEFRFNCCRNFPNKETGMFCSETTRCVYDAKGNVDCFNCKDKCCEHLEIPDNTPIWEVVKILNISCIKCKETYCK
jgi:hypothetical protein